MRQFTKYDNIHLSKYGNIDHLSIQRFNYRFNNFF